MKKTTILLSMMFLFFGLTKAQKYAYVDSEYILSKVPSYQGAQSKLDEMSGKWQKEVEAKYADIEKKYKDYQAESSLLSPEMKTKREDEIVALEKAADDLKEKYFGKDGDLYKKRQELVKPIQDEVYSAIKEVAVSGGYVIIFDKAAGPSMIYADPKFDLSDDVVKKLGY
jgi:outer membrane protein